MKKILIGAAAALMLFGSAAALPQKPDLLSDTSITASAASITVNATKVNIFAMASSWEDDLSIPSTYRQRFQIKVTGAKSVYYYVKSGDSVNVSSTGLITPNSETWYWYGGFGSTFKMADQEPTEVVTDYSFGKSIVTAVADGQEFDIEVNLVDYSETYVNKIINDYISKNVKSTMTDKEKIEQACKMAASYDYSPYCCSAKGMIITGGGDCWASTDLIIRFCQKLGYSAWSRNGNKDGGAGSGHRNAMVYAGGKYYEAEAGYSGTAPRMYNIYQRTSLYCYRFVDADTVCIYQYDGKSFPTNLTIPSKIDGHKVVGIDEDFSTRNGNGYEKIKTLTIPEGVTYIGKSSFNSCLELTTANLPSTLGDIGSFSFTNCQKLTTINIASGNKNFSAAGGALYNKAKTVLICCPAAATITIPSTVKTIGDYAFYYNSNIKKVAIPSGVTEIKEGAFGDCSNLTSVTIPSTVKTIGDHAFRDTNSLGIITVPASVTSIGEYAFYDSSATIRTTAGSTAAKYAKDNDIKLDTSVSIAGSTVTVPAAAYTYTGKSIIPAPTVKLGSKTLKKGTDYTVTYKNNVNVGIATVTVTGTGNYYGSASTTFVIRPAKNEITRMTIYNDNGIKVVWRQGTAGTVGYQVLYTKDKNFKSYYTAIITDRTYVRLTAKPKAGETWYVKVRSFYTKDGKTTSPIYGVFSDTQTFTIDPNIRNMTAELAYTKSGWNGGAMTPAVTVKNGTMVLRNGTDYTVTYKNNTKIGVATATVTGKGDYKGSFSRSFIIMPARNSITSITSTKANCFTLKWNKGAAGTTGYEVIYSKDPTFQTGVERWITPNVSMTQQNFSRVPKSGETWYVKVRSFYTKDGTTTSTRYGTFSAAKSIKVK